MASIITTLINQVIFDAHAVSVLSKEARDKLLEAIDKPTTFLPVVYHGLDGLWLAHLFLNRPFEEAMVAGEAVDLALAEDGGVTATIQLWDTEAGFSAGQRMKKPTGWLRLSMLKNDAGIALQVNVFDREDIDVTVLN